MAYIPTAKGMLEKRELPRMIMAMGVCIGLGAGFVAFVFPAYFPNLFTPDERLHVIMRTLAPQACLPCSTVP